MHKDNIELIRLHSVNSTNKYASALIDNNRAKEGQIIITSCQTEGKGYATNKWFSSENKNLTFTIIVEPKFLKPEHQFALHKISSLSILEVLKKNIPENQHLKIKWPNDIYYKKYKIAGILTENKIIGREIVFSLIGIGININQDIFPKDIPNPISIKQITNEACVIDQFLNELISEFSNRYENLKSSPEIFNKEYLDNLFLKGEYNQYFAKGKSFNGKITGIDNFGFLEITTDNAQKLNFDFKEIKYILKP